MAQMATLHSNRTHKYANYPSPSLLYEVEDINTTITHVTNTYHHDITQYLAFTEWCTITSQHPTMRPSHQLHAPLNDWNTQSSHLNHTTNTQRPTPSQYITAFCNEICLHYSSMTKTHPHTTGSLTIADNDIMNILEMYNSPFLLTIGESFKPP